MSNNEHLLSATHTLKRGGTLTSSEISDAFRVIMGGNAPDGLIGAFLGILATRVPEGKELFGAATVMKECAKCINLPDAPSLLDTCGTGGAPKTFNVSTAAGIVAAACGVRVAKHGNRSRTGRGSAEVLEQLGVNIETTIEQQKLCLEDVGICFCFAPNHHEAVAHVMPVRKSLGFPTIFNLLGPLTNPCSAGRQLLGVWDDVYVEPMAEALLALGTTSSAVVHSSDGLDEVSISAPTRIMFVRDGSLVEDHVKPEDVGLTCWDIKDVTADSLSAATRFINESLLEGGSGGPRDMTVLNTAIALVLAGRADTVSEGVTISCEAIDSGAARRKLQSWVEISNTHTPPTNG